MQSRSTFHRGDLAMMAYAVCSSRRAVYPGLKPRSLVSRARGRASGPYRRWEAAGCQRPQTHDKNRVSNPHCASCVRDFTASASPGMACISRKATSHSHQNIRHGIQHQKRGQPSEPSATTVAAETESGRTECALTTKTVPPLGRAARGRPGRCRRRSRAEWTRPL